MPPRDWRHELPSLAGERLLLREVISSDAVGLFELLTQDPLVCEHISPPPPSIVAFQGFIAWCQQQRALGRAVCFGVVPHGLQHAVGIFQVRALGLDFSVCEWGFALGSVFWGTGIFQEAAPMVAEFAFSTLGAFRIEGRAVTANVRGNAALYKIGAIGEGVLRKAFEADERHHDQYIWGLVSEGWRFPLSTPRKYSEEATRKNIQKAVEEVRSRLANQGPADVSIADVHPFFVSGSPGSGERGKDEP